MSLDEFKIPRKEIEILDLIGNGAFGNVSKARYNSEIVAVKQLHAQRYSERAKQLFRQEALLMKELGHPRVLIYRGYFENDQDIGIVMEYIENGTLFDAIMMKLKFDPHTIIALAYDLASGMNYLHLKNIMHHDLKSANVFLDRYNRAKVGDFGLSVIKNESTSKIANQGAGTASYLGPECFGKHAIFAPASDVYAFSLIVWESVSWEIAYKDLDSYNVTVFVRDGERLPIPSMNYGLGGLIAKCWKQDYKKRPTFTEILGELEPLLSNVGPPGATQRSESPSKMVSDPELHYVDSSVPADMKDLPTPIKSDTGVQQLASNSGGLQRIPTPMIGAISDSISQKDFQQDTSLLKQLPVVPIESQANIHSSNLGTWLNNATELISYQYQPQVAYAPGNFLLI